MSAIDLAGTRLRLLRRRGAILEASRRAERGIDELRGAERDPEQAEESSGEQLQYDLSRIAEVEQLELAQLDAALARLDAGAYGVCRDCGEAIAPERLAALPYVLDCADCAGGREEAQALEREARKRPRPMSPQR